MAEAVLLAKEASVNLNLSDFALFLSVMKNKKAFQNVLEIILDEPIDMEEVKVEGVILNSRGQEQSGWMPGPDHQTNASLLWRCRMIQKRMM